MDEVSETGSSREAIRRAFDAWQRGTGAITDVFAPAHGVAHRGPLGGGP